MRIVKGPCLIDIGPNPSPRASRKASTYKHNEYTSTARPLGSRKRMG